MTDANVLTFTGAGQESLQSILTSKLESGAFDTLVESVQQDKARVAMLTAVKDQHADAWLRAVPKHFTLD